MAYSACRKELRPYAYPCQYHVFHIADGAQLAAPNINFMKQLAQGITDDKAEQLLLFRSKFPEVDSSSMSFRVRRYLKFVTVRNFYYNLDQSIHDPRSTVCRGQDDPTLHDAHTLTYCALFMSRRTQNLSSMRANVCVGHPSLSFRLAPAVAPLRTCRHRCAPNLSLSATTDNAACPSSSITRLKVSVLTSEWTR